MPPLLPVGRHADESDFPGGGLPESPFACPLIGTGRTVSFADEMRTLERGQDLGIIFIELRLPSTWRPTADTTVIERAAAELWQSCFFCWSPCCSVLPAAMAFVHGSHDGGSDVIANGETGQ